MNHHAHPATSPRRVFESALLGLGLVGLLLAGLWQLQILPGSRLDLPAPVAFLGAPGVRAVSAPLPSPRRAPTPSTPALAPPDATPPAAQALPPTVAVLPGVAKRLVIASIDLDTPVVAGGILTGADGLPVWETVPDIAVHYAALTALVGAPGNAVIAGHVSTRAAGNVFIDLYKVELGDAVRVWDDRGAEHDFAITGVRLVPPSDTSVMDATPDPTLTLMTCGGSFDPVRREFSDRLIVTARPITQS